METPLRYSSVEDILMMPTWDSSEKYLLQITVSDGFYLLQVSKVDLISSIFFFNIETLFGSEVIFLSFMFI